MWFDKLKKWFDKLKKWFRKCCCNDDLKEESFLFFIVIFVVVASIDYFVADGISEENYQTIGWNELKKCVHIDIIEYTDRMEH